LTPGVDFDLDFVNARIRDGTTVKKEDEPNKTRKEAKRTEQKCKKRPKTCLRVYMDMEMNEIDGKEKKTYVVGVLGEEHATWRMQSSKMSEMPPLEAPRLLSR